MRAHPDESSPRGSLLADLYRELAASTPDLQAVLHLVAVRTSERFGDAVVVRLLEDGDRLAVAALHHPQPAVRGRLEALSHAPVPLGDGAAVSALRAGHPVRLSGPALEKVRASMERGLEVWLQTTGTGSLLVAPLRARGEVLGAMSVMRHRDAPPHDEADASLLGELADAAALTIDNARLLAAARAEVERRRRVEDELRAVRDQLEARVRRRTEALERSNHDLEQFAYVVSHDLQEPLRMVTSWLGLLTRRHADRLEGEPAEFVAYAVAGAQRMRALLEGLLAFSRVGTQGGPLTDVNLETELARVLADLQGVVAESGAVVTHEPLPTVRADAVQVRQLFQNLLSNAIKFRAGARPHIRISARREDGLWRVSIHDEGIGVAPEHRDRIFEVFERLHGVDEYPGAGVGLAICKRIVERHGGTIGVEPGEEGGSVFWFTLPAAGRAT